MGTAKAPGYDKLECRRPGKKRELINEFQYKRGEHTEHIITP